MVADSDGGVRVTVRTIASVFSAHFPPKFKLSPYLFEIQFEIGDDDDDDDDDLLSLLLL